MNTVLQGIGFAGLYSERRFKKGTRGFSHFTATHFATVHFLSFQFSYIYLASTGNTSQSRTLHMIRQRVSSNQELDKQFQHKPSILHINKKMRCEHVTVFKNRGMTAENSICGFTRLN